MWHRLDAEAEEVKRQVGEVNKQRKLQHQRTGQELAGIEAEWSALIAKNREIAAACQQLEQAIAAKGGSTERYSSLFLPILSLSAVIGQQRTSPDADYRSRGF